MRDPELHQETVTAAGGTAFEVLRLAAMVVLLFYHACVLPPASDGGLAQRLIERLGHGGWIGTDFLLALSGFLAVGSRARAGGAVPFLARRAARVLPAFVAFLALYLFVLPPLLVLGGATGAAAGIGQARAHQGWLWTLTPNLLMVLGRRPGGALEPLLTLGVGAQLTVAAALLPLGRRSRAVPAALVVTVLAGVVLRLVWLHDFDPYRAYSFPFTRCDAFAAGVAAAWYLDDPRVGPWLRAHRLQLLAGAGALLVVAAALTHGLLLFTPATQVLGYPAVGLASGAIVLALSQARHVGRWVRLTAPAGALVYAIYLVKLPVLFGVRAMLTAFHVFHGWGGIVLLFVAGSAASLLVGAALHFALERPLRRAGALLLAPSQPRRPPETRNTPPRP